MCTDLEGTHTYLCTKREKMKIQVFLKCRSQNLIQFKIAVCHAHLRGMMQFIFIFIRLIHLRILLLIFLFSSCTGIIAELCHRSVRKS